MLLKYRYAGIETFDGQVRARIHRLEDLLFFEEYRTPNQKAFDEKLFTEQDCINTIELARRVQPQTFKARYVIQQMQVALDNIREHEARRTMTS